MVVRNYVVCLLFVSFILLYSCGNAASSCGAACCQVNTESDLITAAADTSCQQIHIDGEIAISNTITINRAVDIRGVSADAAVIQTHTGRDGIVIRDVTTGVTLSDLTIDASVAQAALVVANANNVAISRATIFGSESIFAVFFAGRDVAAGQASLNNFASKVDMDTNNSITDSLVRSPWTGDSLSFSLQYLGTVRNNTVVDGGKIAYYMNANSTCIGNTVIDSISQGIYISSPSYGNLVMNNSLINTRYAGIKSKRQYEHEPDANSTFDMNSFHDVIQGNTVESNSYIGIELNDVSCLGVYSNKILRHVSSAGIYLQPATDVSIWRNEISAFNDSALGTLADEVVTYAPSVDHIAILDSTKAWTEVQFASPPCVPPPYEDLVEYAVTPDAAGQVDPARLPRPARTCSTRSCLLEDRSNTITRNVQKFDFTQRYQSGSGRSAESNTAGTKSSPAPRPTVTKATPATKGRSLGNTPPAGTSAGSGAVKTGAQLLAEKMAAKAEEKLKKINTQKK